MSRGTIFVAILGIAAICGVPGTASENRKPEPVGVEFEVAPSGSIAIKVGDIAMITKELKIYHLPHDPQDKRAETTIRAVGERLQFEVGGDTSDRGSAKSFKIYTPGVGVPKKSH